MASHNSIYWDTQTRKTNLTHVVQDKELLPTRLRVALQLDYSGNKICLLRKFSNQLVLKLVILSCMAVTNEKYHPWMKKMYHLYPRVIILNFLKSIS